jgi:hypothetical protein
LFWLQLFALFLVVVGARFWMISTYTSSLPIRDQWDYEGVAVFKPWVDGTFHISDLFKPHNEHRLVLARSLGLGLLWMNGQWDSRLETVVTTLICGLFAVAVAAALVKLFEPKSPIIILLGVAAWLTLPYGQENTLLALGTSYYFLVFFSLIALWGIGFHRAGSPRWWAGAFSLALACLDMASGAFAAMALVGLLGLRLFKRRMTWREGVLPALLLLGVIGAAIYFRTAVPGHEPMKATSLGNWFHVFARSLAWPFCDVPALSVVMYLPTALVAAWALRAPPNSTPTPSWQQAEVFLVVGAWVILQAAAIAYTRGGSPIALPVSRYMEILAFGALANLLATIFFLRQLSSGPNRKRAIGILTVAWALLLVCGAVALSRREMPPRFGPEPALLAFDESVRGYVATGDRKYLEGDIPYPRAGALQLLLDDPAIRNILPANVRPPVKVDVVETAESTFVRGGYPENVSNPPFESAWGSYSSSGQKGDGTLRSEIIQTPFPYLQFEIAGALRNGMSLGLRDERTSQENYFSPLDNAGKGWQSGRVTTPANSIRIIARDNNPQAWFAFRQPRELGRLSVYADTLAKWGPFLLLLGSVLWLMSLPFEGRSAILKFLAHQQLEGASANPQSEHPDKGTRLRGTLARPRLHLGHYLLFCAACLPLILAFYVQVTHWINIPIWDEWDTPGIVLVQAAQHQLSWSDLLGQHNESRKFFPRLLYLAVAALFGWDVRHGMLLTLLSVAAVSVFALRYLLGPERKLNPMAFIPWLLMNALLFGPSQYENFLCGNSFEILVPALALLGCMAVNLSGQPLWKKVGWNSLLIIVANYTFAHGMILWLLALPIPNAEERKAEARLRRFAPPYAAYLLIAALAVGCYFIGYGRPGIAPARATLSQWPQLIEFMVVWLGGVLRSSAVDAHVAGAFVSVVLLAGIILSIVALRLRKVTWTLLYPWLVLAAFSVGSGAITAVGRLNLGISFVFDTGFISISSVRYHLTAVFAYVAAIGLFWSLYREWLQFQAAWRLRLAIAATVCTTLLVVAWLFTFSMESGRLHSFKQSRKQARTAAIWSGVVPQNPALLFAYPPDPNFPNRVAEMKRLGLLKLPEISPKIATAIRALPEATSIEAGVLDSGAAKGATEFRMQGWARNPRRNRAADTIVVGWEENGSFRPYLVVPTGEPRPDVAEAFKSPLLRNAGFDCRIDLSQLPRQAQRLCVWAVDSEAQEIFPVHGFALVPERAIP